MVASLPFLETTVSFFSAPFAIKPSQPELLHEERRFHAEDLAALAFVR